MGASLQELFKSSESCLLGFESILNTHTVVCVFCLAVGFTVFTLGFHFLFVLFMLLIFTLLRHDQIGCEP